MSQKSSPPDGTTLKASPLFMIVGTTVSRSGPAGSCSAATLCAAAASASRALRPRSGAEPLCAETPAAPTRRVAAALRLTTRPSSPFGPPWPASKQRHASKPANRSA